MVTRRWAFGPRAGAGRLPRVKDRHVTLAPIATGLVAVASGGALDFAGTAIERLGSHI